jgi:hypothetical protein
MTTVSDIIREAFDAAQNASKQMYDKIGGDGYACGFAWVEVYKVRRNSKLGKELIEYGFKPSWKSGQLDLWNPGGMNVQNIDIKEEGAEAFARVLREKLGISAYAGSRLD